MNIVFQKFCGKMKYNNILEGIDRVDKGKMNIRRKFHCQVRIILRKAFKEIIGFSFWYCITFDTKVQLILSIDFEIPGWF